VSDHAETDFRDAVIDTMTKVGAARERQFSRARQERDVRTDALRLCAAALQAAAKAKRPIDEAEVVTIEGRSYSIAGILDIADRALEPIPLGMADPRPADCS
jgi:hypothetical protein